MKLNINKEKLLKHKFWIMLGVAVPLILAGQFVLLGPVAGEIETAQKAVKQTIASAKSYKTPAYNEDNAKKRLEEAKELKAKEEKTWGELYEKQAADMFWPARIEEKYPVRPGKFLREVKFVDAANPGVPDDVHHLTGNLVNSDDRSIFVVGKDNQKHQFFHMAKEDMKIPEGKQVEDLLVGKDVQVTFQTGWYFGDKLSETQRTEYVNSYATQLRPILDIVDPVNEDGDGVVILKDWLVPKNKNELPPKGVRFLRFVHPPWNANSDISDEAWLAQEDLWIQKELYRLIRQANNYVGKMDGKGVVGLNQTATYKNPYFELALKLVAQDKLEVTIRNLQNKRQKLEVKFRARFSEDKSLTEEKFTVDGEPLDPRGTKDKQGVLKDSMTKIIDLPPGVKRTGIYNLEQALTWETAAVRRIDSISIGTVSGEEIAINHRSYPEGVKPLVPEKKEEPAPDAAPKDAPPVQGVRGQDRFGNMNRGGAGAPAADLTINGLSKNRYSEEPTEQARRLPVAITLIVDQDHIDRVLTSFGNSKLRFLLNQFMVNRYPLSVRPPIVAHDGAAPPAPFGGPFGKGPPFGVRPEGGRPFGPGHAAALAPNGEESVEANVELVLYGTVTIYQRFPSRSLEAPK